MTVLPKRRVRHARCEASTLGVHREANTPGAHRSAHVYPPQPVRTAHPTVVLTALLHIQCRVRRARNEASAPGVHRWVTP